MCNIRMRAEQISVKEFSFILLRCNSTFQSWMTPFGVMRKRSNAFYRKRAFSQQGKLANQRRFGRPVHTALTSHQTFERVWQLREAVAFRNVEIRFDTIIFQRSKCGGQYPHLNATQLAPIARSIEAIAIHMCFGISLVLHVRAMRLK